MRRWTRRHMLAGLGGGMLSLAWPAVAKPLLPDAARRVVVVGGGFGGAIAAKYIRALDRGIEVVVIERQPRYVASPFSTQVLTGLRSMDSLTVDYGPLQSRYGVRFVFDTVSRIDPAAKTVHTGGGTLRYDRLILAPGIDFDYEAIEGASADTTAQVMPHAWQAGPQTLRLKAQLDALPEGGNVIITVPPMPYRCPPAPYERACLIAAWMQRTGRRGKVIVLDANPDVTVMGDLFRTAWATRYPGRIDYHPDAPIERVDEAARRLVCAGGEVFSAEVINLVPAQRAGVIARTADLTGADGTWCPVDPLSFESTRHAGVHVIGDAAMAGEMPKSAYAANAEAKICAMNVVALMNERPVQALAGLNGCYAAIGEDEAISITRSYRVDAGRIVSVPASAAQSPADLSNARLEHRYAEGWLANMLAEMTL